VVGAWIYAAFLLVLYTLSLFLVVTRSQLALRDGWVCCWVGGAGMAGKQRLVQWAWLVVGLGVMLVLLALLVVWWKLRVVSMLGLLLSLLPLLVLGLFVAILYAFLLLVAILAVSAVSFLVFGVSGMQGLVLVFGVLGC
jgi:hypothetical protein